MKVILLGEPSVGKSTLVRILVHGNSDANNNNIMYQSSLVVQTDTIGDMELFDIPGNYYNMWSHFIADADLILLIFDLSNVSTFLKLQLNWIDILSRDLSPNSQCQFILVGNKLDIGPHRQVLYNEASVFANRYAMDYIEISCCSQCINIDTLERLMRRHKRHVEGYDCSETYKRICSNTSTTSTNMMATSTIWEKMKKKIKNIFIQLKHYQCKQTL